MLRFLRRCADGLASPRLLFGLLPALMVLVAVGTLAQKYVGLYVAERTIFTSFVIWIGGYVPVPGGYALMGLLALALGAKFLLRTHWSRARVGVNLAHLGVLLLLIGGLIAGVTGEAGFLVLAEGETGRSVLDYHERELVILQGETVVATVPQAQLRAGGLIGAPVRLEVLDACRNCRVVPGQDGQGMALEKVPLQKQDEANLGGVTLRADDGRMLSLFEGGPVATVGGYAVLFAKHQRPLPFSVTLRDVEKITYPGTDQAQTYFSDITIHDGSLAWPARVGLNEPVRLAGYTLYQSSYLEADGNEATVLAVTRNRGRWFPYAATGILALGLALHGGTILRRRRAS